MMILLNLQWLNADEKNREEFQKIESYWNANLKYDYPMTAENSFKKLQQKNSKVGYEEF